MSIIFSLPNPPCFPGLAGCGEGDRLFDFSGIGQSGLLNPQEPSSTDAISTGAGIDFDLLSARLKEYASNSALSRQAKQYLADYTIHAKNMSGKLLSGVTIDHGPIPFGAIFQPLQSDPRCALVQKIVRCTTTMRGGESQDFTISYETTSGFTCRFARILERAKVAYSVLRSEETPEVMISVDCTTRAVPRAGSLFENAQRSSSSGAGGEGGLGGAGADVGGGGRGGDGLTTQGGEGFTSEGGYKPYTPLPQTGADPSFFIATAEAKTLIEPQHAPMHQSAESAWLMPFAIAMTCIFVLGYALYRRMCAK